MNLKRRAFDQLDSRAKTQSSGNLGQFFKKSEIGFY